MATVRAIEIIAVVGTGKVATTLLRIFKNAGFHIHGIAGRNAQKGQTIASAFETSFFTDVKELHADLILISVADSAVLEVAHSFPKNQWIAHTSGSIELPSHLVENGAVFYPLQTFTEGRNLQAANIPILLETHNTLFKNALEKLCQHIGFSYQFYSSEERKKIHVSAVFINNFVNHLVYKAGEIAQENGIDKELFLPLLEETFQKVKQVNAFDAQTGPARRKDNLVIEAHLNMLEGINQEVYALLTKSIQNTYKND